MVDSCGITEILLSFESQSENSHSRRIVGRLAWFEPDCSLLTAGQPLLMAQVYSDTDGFAQCLRRGDAIRAIVIPLRVLN